MDNMQAEALRRAQEMHRNRDNPRNNRPPQTSQRESQRETQRESARDDRDHSSTKDGYQSTEGNCIVTEKKSSPVLFEDKEKVLILVLIMILCTEDNSDPTLILALLYLII